MAVRTLAQLRTEIQNRGYGTDTAAAQTSAINAVYRRVAGMRRWPWLEVTRATGPDTVAGTETYDLDATLTDLLHVDAVRLEFGTEYYDLDYRPREQFREIAHVNRDQGTPQFWTKTKADTIALWPVPDKAYDMSVDYVKRVTLLSADGDSHVMPEDYEEILIYGAIADLCIRERDPEGRAMALEEMNKRIIDMMNEYGLRQRQTSSEVVRSGYWDGPRYVDGDLWVI